MKRAPFLVLVATATMSASTASAVEYVNDPLTDPNFPGRGSQGGTFAADGWTVTGEPDAVWYEIADALPEARVEYTVTGLSLATSMTGADHDIFTIYQAPTGQPEPVAYSPYFRNNDFKAFTRIFGTQEPGRAGAMKLELAFCPRGDPWYHDEACTPECEHSGIAYANGVQEDVGWDAATSYRMAVEWGNGMMTFYRDNAPLGSVAYGDTYAPQPLRIRLGSPRHQGIYPGLAFMPIGITIKDVLVTGTPGAMTAVCGEGGAGGGGGGAGGSGGSGNDYGVLADVTAASWETGVFPDVADLNVEADASGMPAAVVYLKFPPIDGVVDQAILQVRSHDFPSAAGDSGIACAVDDDTWSEDTLTWATRPAVGASCAGVRAPIDSNSVIEWDVTSIVAAGSNVNLAIVSAGDNGAHYVSKEAGDPSFGPRLLVQSHPSSGAGGAGGGSGGSSDGGTGTGASGSNGTPVTDSASDDGCGCRTAPRGDASPVAAILLAVSAALGRRRRRHA